MVMTDEKKRALEQINSNEERLTEISDTIWRLAEVGMQEYESAKVLENFLEENGFKIESGVAGMPTAFVATYGSGSPVIGITAEYDALPEISNEVLPYRKPLVDGGPGHGCGHSAFGAACVGAAVAVKTVMDEKKLKGTLKLFGTPAEEMCIGKPFMARAGLFDDMDAALSWHPGRDNAVRLGSTCAYDSVVFKFHGYSSHGCTPWNGNDALAAAEVMDSTINIIRGYVEPNTTINRTVLDATQFANVLSDSAEVWYIFRNPSREYLTRLRNWIIEAGEAAAKVMRCKVDVNFITGVWPRLINKSMGEIIQSNMELAGPLKFTDEEKELAKKLQATYPERLIPKGGFKYALNESLSGLEVSTAPPVGTTDNADVSWFAPMCEFSTTTNPYGCPGHSWQSVVSHGSSIAHKGLILAAKTLALTTIHLVTKPEALANTTAEYKERKGKMKYIPAIPVEIEPTLDMHTKYQDEYRRALKIL